MKAYSTKYALTTGIDEVEIEFSGNYGYAKCSRTGVRSWLNKGVDWHETREQAIARADEMRKARIASLRKQIARLEAMRFGGE